MKIDTSILFSVLVALIGVYATYHKIRRDNKRDEQERQIQATADREKQTERHIEIKKELEYIAKDMSKLDVGMTGINARLDEIDRRVTKTEESAKSAHHRIDSIERR